MVVPQTVNLLCVGSTPTLCAVSLEDSDSEKSALGILAERFKAAVY